MENNVVSVNFGSDKRIGVANTSSGNQMPQQPVDMNRLLGVEALAQELSEFQDSEPEPLSTTGLSSGKMALLAELSEQLSRRTR